jgi:ElaB/YqjD/DUF883 family membrane-anchored ribosome-binding protein
MAEAWRNNVLGTDVHYPTGAELEDEFPGTVSQLPELPERGTPANNPALTRSAEAVGRSVGTAVAGVRELPRHIDKLRSRLQVVGRKGSSPAFMRDTVDELRAAAENKASELKDQVESYTYGAANRASSRLAELRQRAQWRINLLRVSTRRWIGEARHWEYERPFRVIAISAAAAFTLGVALRIWRSNSD